MNLESQGLPVHAFVSACLYAASSSLSRDPRAVSALKLVVAQWPAKAVESAVITSVPALAINYGIRHWAGLVCLINGWQALGIGSGPLTLYRARGEVTSN